MKFSFYSCNTFFICPICNSNSFEKIADLESLRLLEIKLPVSICTECGCNNTDYDTARNVSTGYLAWSYNKYCNIPNEYGIYQVFGDLTISISNGISGEEIMSKSYNQIQGSDFNSNREAANQSLKKISIKITEDFLPEILSVIEGL